jgi:hypothetical protein
MSQPLYLRKHLFVRECDGSYVFLDIVRNRYFTFSDAQSRRLAKRLGSGGDERAAECDDHLMEKLIEEGVLTRDATQGKPLASVVYSNTEFSITHSDPTTEWALLARDLPPFLRALFAAVRWRQLSHSKLDAVIRAVKAWKSVLPPPSPDARAHVIALTQRFHALSPFVFTAHDACFFRSLFLVRYLALRGLAADWVFAVRLCPFGAHCWVEFDHVLLNEDRDRALEYRPIMLV